MTEPSAGLPRGRGRRLSPHLSHKAIKWKVPGLGREQVLAGGGTGLIRAARPCTHRRDLLSGPVTAFQSDIKLVPLFADLYLEGAETWRWRVPLCPGRSPSRRLCLPRPPPTGAAVPGGTFRFLGEL